MPNKLGKLPSQNYNKPGPKTAKEKEALARKIENEAQNQEISRFDDSVAPPASPDTDIHREPKQAAPEKVVSGLRPIPEEFLGEQSAMTALHVRTPQNIKGALDLVTMQLKKHDSRVRQVDLVNKALLHFVKEELSKLGYDTDVLNESGAKL